MRIFKDLIKQGFSIRKRNNGFIAKRIKISGLKADYSPRFYMVEGKYIVRKEDGKIVDVTA